MSTPDFERAEYLEPQAIDPLLTAQPIEPRGTSPFPVALAAGALAAVVGSVGYALFSLTGIMVGIVAVGIAWLIAKAMMTASHGIGGRPYQIAAVILTYFACSFGELLHPLWTFHHQGVPLGALMSPVFFRFLFFGPILEGNDGINGILGLVILGVGIRAAWRMTAGGPGFGSSGGRRITPFG